MLGKIALMVLLTASASLLCIGCGDSNPTATPSLPSGETPIDARKLVLDEKFGTSHNSTPLVSETLLPSSISQEISADEKTPQGAVLVFEAAIAKQDSDGVAAAMDFEMAARNLLIEQLKIPAESITPEQLAVASQNLRTDRVRQVVELSAAHGPRAIRRFVSVEPRHLNLAVVTRQITAPGGHKSELRILVGKSDSGWRVLEVLD